MLARRLPLAFLVLVLEASLSACAADGGADAPSQLGTTAQEITEVNCSYRSVSAPTSGTVVSSYAPGCSDTSYTSPDGTYGYANCTHGYIVHVSAFSLATGQGSSYRKGKLRVKVGPGTVPTTQSACEGTYVSAYLYADDAVGTTNTGPNIPYDTNTALLTHLTWHPSYTSGGFTFPAYCDPYLVLDWDLTNLNGVGKADNVRVIANAFTKSGSTETYQSVQVRLTSSLENTSPACIW